MNRQLIAVYAVLPDGVYRYDAAKNALEQVLAGDYLKLYSNGAPLVLLHAAKESDRYSPFHVGSMYENVALYCASAGLANVMKAQETNRLDGSLPLPGGGLEGVHDSACGLSGRLTAKKSPLSPDAA